MKKGFPLLVLALLLCPTSAHAQAEGIATAITKKLTGWATDAFVPSSASIDKFANAAGAISDWGPFGMVKNTFGTISNVNVAVAPDAGLVWRASPGAKFGPAPPSGFGASGYTVGSGTGTFTTGTPTTGGAQNGGYKPTPKPSASPGSSSNVICKDVTSGSMSYSVSVPGGTNNWQAVAAMPYSLTNGGQVSVYWSLSAVGDVCLTGSNSTWRIRVGTNTIKTWVMNDAVACSPSYMDSATVTLPSGQSEFTIDVSKPTSSSLGSVSGTVDYIRVQSGNCTAPQLPQPTPSPTPSGASFTVRMITIAQGGDLISAGLDTANIWTSPNGGGGGYPANVLPAYLSTYAFPTYTFNCPAAGNYVVYCDNAAGPLFDNFKLRVNGVNVGNAVPCFNSVKGGVYNQYMGVIALVAGSNTITLGHVSGGGGYLLCSILKFSTASAGTGATTMAVHAPASYTAAVPSPHAGPSPTVPTAASRGGAYSRGFSAGATYSIVSGGTGGTGGTGGIPSATAAPTLFNAPDSTGTGTIICDFRPLDTAAGTGSFPGTVRLWGRYLVGLAVYGACMIWAFRVTQVKVSMD